MRRLNEGHIVQEVNRLKQYLAENHLTMKTLRKHNPHAYQSARHVIKLYRENREKGLRGAPSSRVIFETEGGQKSRAKRTKSQSPKPVTVENLKLRAEFVELCSEVEELQREAVRDGIRLGHTLTQAAKAQSRLCGCGRERPVGDFVCSQCRVSRL